MTYKRYSMLMMVYFDQFLAKLRDSVVPRAENCVCIFEELWQSFRLVLCIYNLRRGQH